MAVARTDEQVEVTVGRVDDDRAGGVLAPVGHRYPSPLLGDLVLALERGQVREVILDICHGRRLALEQPGIGCRSQPKDDGRGDHGRDEAM